MDVLRDLILNIAQRSVEEIVKKKKVWIPSLEDKKYSNLRQKQGAFTTLWKLDKDEKNLRGCIGFPQPHYPLAHSIAKSAKQAATEDPRFKPVTADELSALVIEVEALSTVSKIEYNSIDELYDKIEVGKHGLIVSYQGFRGLLLPKVAPRYSWNTKEFVEHTCQKAGLPKDVYLRQNVEIFSFTSILYSQI